MPAKTAHDSEPETLDQPGRLSANAHWTFGSIYALMALVGFGFGIWAGAHKPKTVEVADAKQKDNVEKPTPKQPTAPPPSPTPGAADPKPVEPEPKPKEPLPVVKEPEPKEPAPKPKEPDPKLKEPTPKPKEPPKPDVKPVVFKDVVPILRTHCFDCHGAAGKPKGGVDVTSIAKMLSSKKKPLVPGKPEESSLYTTTASGEMPKDRKGPNARELKLLYDWIAGGAKERRRVVRGRVVRRKRKVELTRAAGAG